MGRVLSTFLNGIYIPEFFEIKKKIAIFSVFLVGAGVV